MTKPLCFQGGIFIPTSQPNTETGTFAFDYISVARVLFSYKNRLAVLTLKCTDVWAQGTAADVDTAPTTMRGALSEHYNNDKIQKSPKLGISE